MSPCNNDGKTLIPFDDVLSFKDAVVVQNSVNFRNARDIDFTAFHCGLIDMPVYTQMGVLKGIINEIEFSQNGKVVKIGTENEQYSPSAILSVGNAAILKGTPKTQKPKQQKIPRPTVETLAVIENSTENEKQAANQAQYVLQGDILHSAPPAVFVSENSPLFTKDAFDAIMGEESEYEDTHTPTRVICDYEFLLGRVLSQNLDTYANQPIAKKGDIVTDEIVNKARLAGKLVELTLNSIKQSQ